METIARLWENTLLFCNKYGNLASVIGFIITIIGFALTLYRLWTIGKETKKAETTARQGIERLGAQLLALEVSGLNHFMDELMIACRDQRWQNAIEKCHLIRISVARLTEHPHLDEEDKMMFRSSYDDFSILIRYIEKNRMKGKIPGADLPDLKKKAIDDIAKRFLNIESRMRHSLLERPNEPR